MSRVAHMNESCLTYSRCTCDIHHVTCDVHVLDIVWSCHMKDHMMYMWYTSCDLSCDMWWMTRSYVQQSSYMWCTCDIHLVIITWHEMYICYTSSRSCHMKDHMMYMWYTSCYHHVTCDVHVLYIMRSLGDEQVKYMDKSCHTHEWVVLHIWMGHGTHMNESWYTNE